MSGLPSLQRLARGAVALLALLSCAAQLGLWLGWAVLPAAVLAWWGGAVHAAAYAALLWAFGRTLRAGRVPLVTQWARRLNPHFHAGMLGYTRGVTRAWAWLFGAELAASALLLGLLPGWWPGFVAGGHALPVLALGLAEYALRRWRFGNHSTHWRTMLAAFRRR